MKLSVIIPIYNASEFLPTLFKNLKANSKHLDHTPEILLIDDGSTDNSYELCKQFVAETKGARVYHQKNSGPSAARNLGLEKTHGDYITFIDADDKIAPTFLKTLLDEIEKSPDIPLVSTAVKRIKSDKTENIYDSPAKPYSPAQTWTEYLLSLLLPDGRLYPIHNKIFRADIIKTNQLRFDESINFAEDLKFVLEYLKLTDTPEELVFLSKPLYTYYQSSGVFSENATKWANYEKSFNFLTAWALTPRQNEQFTKTQLRHISKLLQHIKLRWRISCLLNNLRSSKK